jgi:uncharacterized protein (DUF58 family)
MVLLLAGAVLSPLPYSLLALAILMAQAYSTWQPLRVELELPLAVATLVLTPMILEPFAGGLFSVLLIAPALPLLQRGLSYQAQRLPFEGGVPGRKPTLVLRALWGIPPALVVMSFPLMSQSLAFTGLLLAGYLGGVVAYILWRIPRVPLEGSRTWARALAGDTVHCSLNLKARGPLRLRAFLESPYPWVRLDPSELALEGNAAEVGLTMVPPLAGPSSLELRASVMDPWGLLQTNQTLGGIDLYVIPRARYAEWLARRYLERTRPGAAGAAWAAAPPRTPQRVTGRVEYLDSRLFQAGDSLRDMDWKHTAKLGQLIVKEYTGSRGQMALLVVNLAVADAEEADWLAYAFLTTCVTLAREALPVALVAYNRDEILTTTRPSIDPRETVKKALELAQRVVVVEPVERVLHLPDIRRLRRAITQLQQTGSEPAGRLAEILGFEYEALQEGVRSHPATRALAKGAPMPGTVVLISPWNHDAVALLVMLDKLEKQGYSAMVLRPGQDGSGRGDLRHKEVVIQSRRRRALEEKAAPGYAWS